VLVVVVDLLEVVRDGHRRRGERCDGER